MIQTEKLDSIRSNVLAAPASHLSDLHGDFYLEDNTNITRGCGLGWGVGGDPAPFTSADDYYSDETHITRGIAMAGLGGSDGVFGKVMDDTENWQRGPSQFNGFSKEDTFGIIPGYAQQQPVPVFQRSDTANGFQQDTQPPTHSDNEHFFDDATMMRIKTSSPHNLGNTVLEFLDSQVVASISKTNREKYTVKLDAFVDTIMCSLKIKIWKSPTKDEEYVVQFLRRAGDPFTFGHLRAQACNFLSARFPGSSMPQEFEEVDDFLPLPPPPPLEIGPLDERDINPLTEMLAMPIATLQAEAAAALSKIAFEDPVTSKFLCKPSAFDQIEWALSSTDLSVTYPTSRLLSVVVLQKDAEHLLAEQNLLKAMIEKVGNSRTQQIVRLELAKAISSAMRRCAPFLSNGRAGELQNSLEQAIQELGKSSDSIQICNSLEDALLELLNCKCASSDM